MAEESRLLEDKDRVKNWKRWGPYLSERQWATVREDYSESGQCWDYFPHDHARSRAYRWGEDGLLGITDRECRLCIALALWNGKDPILKERLFGLTGSQGNHGEDCKECYYYLDSTPTHSYMKALYKYPQAPYPYSQLESVNGSRSKDLPEYELEDTGVFADNRYWDVLAEYAKADDNDLLCRYTVTNRGPDSAVLHVLPTIWFRNTWIWGCKHEGCTMKPKITASPASPGQLVCTHESLPDFVFAYDLQSDGSQPSLIYTENETNSKRLFGVDNYTPYVKDAFHRYVVDGQKDAVSPRPVGTKVAAVYEATVASGQSAVIKCRLFPRAASSSSTTDLFGHGFDAIFKQRLSEADDFYGKVLGGLCGDSASVARQAYAGLLWSKQFYHYVVADWLTGDCDQPPPPAQRLGGRNKDWQHLFNRDVISVPDKWEYPWYASWDLAFHMIPMADVDIEFAKQQLILFLREWYMHPSGQIPAYEFELGDVNPPVHAWAVLKLHKKTGPRGSRDDDFLARCFQKLVINFTWWVNRKDPRGRNIFSGGFLGLDNIGVFDRSKPLPTGGSLEQADGTAWMAFFCITMLDIALVLAENDPVYADMASKFFEHFVSIADAINKLGANGLWNEEDGFYYDSLRYDDGSVQPLKVRSMVGLVPLFATLTMEESRMVKLGDFHKRTQWFLKYRTDLSKRISFMSDIPGQTSTTLSDCTFILALPTKEQLISVMKYVLDEEEFLSPYGIRSLSKHHARHPFVMHVSSEEYRVDYVPGESNTFLFGGNSNWRGPIWLCMNYLLIESLRRYYFYYRDSLELECPTGSGIYMSLEGVANELSARLCRLFEADPHTGQRPCHGGFSKYATDPFWKDLVLFYEYFDGDSGRGCGASHQTGWTALIANCLRQCAGSPANS